MYNASVATSGHFQMNDNNITAVDVGLDMDYFYWIGAHMEGSSNFSFGDFEIQRNVINSTGSNGIECDIQNLAYNNFDRSRAVFGNFLFNDNDIIAGDGGIYVGDWYDLGSYLYDNASFVMGSILFNENHITSSDDGHLLRVLPGAFWRLHVR